MFRVILLCCATARVEGRTVAKPEFAEAPWMSREAMTLYLPSRF